MMANRGVSGDLPLGVRSDWSQDARVAPEIRINTVFRDREEAGRLLATRLLAYRDDPTALILALPRGGVAVGYQMSLVLCLPLDVFITRKIGAPDNPEFALGAISETGSLYLNREAIALSEIEQEALDKLIRAQQEEIARRQALYRQGRNVPMLTDRTVLLVDDGIATGATFFASLNAIRDLKPRRLVGAIPVGPRETLEEVARKVDKLVVLEVPEPFFAVGCHYTDFTQVEDADVIRYLDLAEQALRSHRQEPSA
ncbi:MAG TPA: phosphoribosyltransferase [Nitrospiraceae bacterium]|jgi:predicted phosphoribosyltransferase|nr:phosphoribosyltransferase [Nitrospiraceae bacterium]